MARDVLVLCVCVSEVIEDDVVSEWIVNFRRLKQLVICLRYVSGISLVDIHTIMLFVYSFCVVMIKPCGLSQVRIYSQIANI